MPAYTATNWVNGSTPVNATNMNHIETQLTAVQYSLNLLTTPYLLISNGTINAGVTNTYSCTGVGTPTIPTGIVGVMLNVFFTPSAAGTNIALTPHSTAWAAGSYPTVGCAANGTNIVCGQALVAVDNIGRIDVQASGGNATGCYIGIMAYLY